MNETKREMDAGRGRTLDTVVIGGGQAGLAIGYHLVRQRRDIVILDAHDRIGDAWRLRWDSLRLFTPAKYDGLPGLPFPGDRLGFPTKDQEADYLERYASRFELPVRTGVRVDRVRRLGDGFVVESDGDRWEARNVVLATGGYQVPRVPEFADRLEPSVLQLHSHDYRNPGQLRPGPVLVVGVGNAGAEIALEVSRTHRTAIAGTPTGQLPLRHGRALARFGLPIIRFAGTHVLTYGTPVGRRILPKLAGRGAPLIRTRLAELEAAGVTRVERIIDIRDGRPLTRDGDALEVANVIWCTGYRDDLSWVALPAFDERGVLRQRRGVVDPVPGLYVIGRELMYAMTSGTLPGVARDAAYLAGRMRRAPDRGGRGLVRRGSRDGAARLLEPQGVSRCG